MSEVKRWYIGVYNGEAQARVCAPRPHELIRDTEGETFVIAEQFDACEARNRALQQRLTAADERNDLAIDLLRRARAVIAGGGWADLERDIAYLFKPAEPARCTNCDRATVEQCDDAGCGFLGAGNGAPE